MIVQSNIGLTINLQHDDRLEIDLSNVSRKKEKQERSSVGNFCAFELGVFQHLYSFHDSFVVIRGPKKYPTKSFDARIEI